MNFRDFLLKYDSIEAAYMAISKGEKITLENITIKGPGHGLFPKYLNLVLGKKVTKDISIDSPLTWDDLLNK